DRLRADEAEGARGDLLDRARLRHLGDVLERDAVDVLGQHDQVHARRSCLGSTSRSTAADFRIMSSVVAQSTQASVTEQPYLSCDRSAGIGWLPASRLLSIIRPTIDWLPSRIWCMTSFITSGWYSGFFHELACEQSTTMFFASLAFASACSASDTDTVS